MQGVSSSRPKPSGGLWTDEMFRRPSPVEYPIRLGPPSQQGGMSASSRKESQAARGNMLQGKRSLADTRRHRRTGLGESLSSSGTQMSIDYSVGDGKYGPIRMKPPAETGVGRKMSGGSESVSSLTRNRSLSSSGTIRTAGSSVERRVSSGTKNWVAKESRRAPYVSPFSSPRAADLKHQGHNRESRENSEMWVKQAQSPAANQSAPLHDIPMTRKEMMARADRHNDSLVPSRSLVVSPRNQPSPHEDSAPSQPQHDDMNHDRAHDQNIHVLPSLRSVANRPALGDQTPEDLDSQEKKGSNMSGWTGLTKETMDLLLKLREDEEVRLLRQRAVTRWLNHLPLPSKYVVETLASSEGTSEMSSLVLNESSELDSILDGSQQLGSSPAVDSQYQTVSQKHKQSTVDRKNSLVVSPVGIIQKSLSRSDSSMTGADVAVDKPEFEFVDIVDAMPTKSMTAEGPSSASHETSSPDTPFAAMPAFEQGYKPLEKLNRLHYGSFEKYSGDLDAIPEIDGGSAHTEEEHTDNAKDLGLHSTGIIVGMDLLSESDTQDLPQRPSSAADRWTSAFSSIEHWVESRSALKPSQGNFCYVQKCAVGPEPDLEIAIDVQERLNSLARSRSLGPLSDEALTPKSAFKHTYSPMVKDTKDGGLGWYFSDDCDSSRIAAGSQPTDASKSPRTRQHTQLLSPRSSMYSDEGGLRFHVKYSIPEDEVVTGTRSMEECESELLRANTTDEQLMASALDSPPATPREKIAHNRMHSEAERTSCKGGSMDFVECDSIQEELERQQACWTGPSEEDGAEEFKDVQDVGSRNPQGTYWLPDFCQNNVVEPLDLSGNRDSRLQPSTWHVNPLSLSGGERRQKRMSHSSGSRGSSSSKIPKVYPQKKVQRQSTASKRVQFHANLDQRDRASIRSRSKKNSSRASSHRGHCNKSRDQSKTACSGLFGFIAAIWLRKK